MRLNFEFPVLAKRTVDSVAVLVKTYLVLGYCPEHDCYLRRAVVSCARNKPSIKKVIYSRVAYMRPSGLHAVDSQKVIVVFIAQAWVWRESTLRCAAWTSSLR